MPTINEDLWPKLELGKAATPLSILREQAGLLTKRTRGVLTGDVETWTSGAQVGFAFNIVVPALGGYKYTLFLMHYFPTQPTGYPVFVDTAPKGAPNEKLADTRIDDETALRDWLRLTLASDEVKRLVESLYTQASA
jgi:hypothetical protein